MGKRSADETGRRVLKTRLKPWPKKHGCFRPLTAAFFWRREEILDVSAAPSAPKRPGVCCAERPLQLLRAVHDPAPGQPRREESEDHRQGTCHLLLLGEPARGWREVVVTARRTSSLARGNGWGTTCLPKRR